MKKFILIVILGFMSLPALAEDFTFRVPVQLANLQAERYLVNCSVYASNGSRIGTGKHATTATNFSNSLNRTVTVKFDASQGKNPADAVRYTCFINLYGTKNGVAVNMFGNANLKTAYNSHYDPDIISAAYSVSGSL